MTVRFWYKLVAKWPCKPAHSNWINLSMALQGQLWWPRKSGRILIKHLEAIPLGYLKHTSFGGMTNGASRRGTLEKPQKMLWAPIGEVFCIPLRLVFILIYPWNHYHKPNQPFSQTPLVVILVLATVMIILWRNIVYVFHFQLFGTGWLGFFGSKKIWSIVSTIFVIFVATSSNQYVMSNLSFTIFSWFRLICKARLISPSFPWMSKIFTMQETGPNKKSSPINIYKSEFMLFFPYHLYY